jgi:hypothetical protein
VQERPPALISSRPALAGIGGTLADSGAEHTALTLWRDRAGHGLSSGG